MYGFVPIREIKTPHQTSTLHLLTLSALFVCEVATVDCFTLSTGFDELLLTGVLVRYWSEDEIVQII